MNRPSEIRTPRLLLREWRESDLAPFAALNGDPDVTEYLPGRLTREESDAMVARIRAHFDAHGFGFWAAEHKGELAGLLGLARPNFQAAFTPCVEIGWRLACKFWKQGLATEGARAALGFAFDTLGLERVVSFTVPDNLPSRRVMERLGMRRDPAGDFDHPKLPKGHRLRRHVLYTIYIDEWKRSQAAGGQAQLQPK